MQHLFTTSIATTLVLATVLSHFTVAITYSLVSASTPVPLTFILSTETRVILLKRRSCHSSAENSLLSCNTIPWVKVKVLQWSTRSHSTDPHLCLSDSSPPTLHLVHWRGPATLISILFCFFLTHPAYSHLKAFMLVALSA